MIVTHLPLQTRLARFEAPSSDSEERIFNVVFTTGAIVRRYNFLTDETYDEELVVDPSAVRLDRLNSGAAPVLDSHSDGALENLKGVVVGGSVRIANGLGTARLKIDGGPENESILRKIREGILRNVSIGYRVHQYEIHRNEGAVPIYRAIDWEPYEISLVPIGADAGAGIRAPPPGFPCEVLNSQPLKEFRCMNKLDNTVQTQEMPGTLLPPVTSEAAEEASLVDIRENPDNGLEGA